MEWNGLDWIGMEGLGHSLSSLLSYSLVTIDVMLNSWQYFCIDVTQVQASRVESRDLLRRLGALRKVPSSHGNIVHEWP